MAAVKEYVLRTEREGFYDITAQVTQAVTESGVEDGMAFIYCPHTTSAITITENTDENVNGDILMSMERAFPDYKDFRHREDNAFAHVKSSMMGSQLFVIVDAGWPLLGPWQAVYFVEFDGPRERHFYVKVMSDPHMEKFPEPEEKFEE